MPVTSTTNKHTQQPPIAGASMRAVIAERAYIKSLSGGIANQYSDPGALLSGSDPAGWTDLGIVAGSKVQLTYSKDVKYVETGIDKVARGAYTMGKSAEAQFVLEQFDLDTINLISGLSVTSIGGLGGKMHIGQDDVVEKALLFVGTNKVDGKEYHTHCGKASLTYSIQDQDDSRVLQVNAKLYAYLVTGQSVDSFFTLIVLD